MENSYGEGGGGGDRAPRLSGSSDPATLTGISALDNGWMHGKLPAGSFCDCVDVVMRTISVSACRRLREAACSVTI